jgi:hypothetical protein
MALIFAVRAGLKDAREGPETAPQARPVQISLELGDIVFLRA